MCSGQKGILVLFVYFVFHEVFRTCVLFDMHYAFSFSLYKFGVYRWMNMHYACFFITILPVIEIWIKANMFTVLPFVLAFNNLIWLIEKWNHLITIVCFWRHSSEFSFQQRFENILCTGRNTKLLKSNKNTLIVNHVFIFSGKVKFSCNWLCCYKVCL